MDEILQLIVFPILVGLSIIIAQWRSVFLRICSFRLN